MGFKSSKRTRVVYLAMVEAGSDIALVNGERFTSNLHPQSHANRGKIRYLCMRIFTIDVFILSTLGNVND